QRQLVALDGMGDHRRLLGIVAHALDVVDDRARQRRGLHLAHRRGLACQARHDLRGIARGRQGAGEEHEAGRVEPGAEGAGRRAQTGTTLTAHFLKSVCLEMGSVASSVALLMSWLASNQGTKTTPGGMRLRPRVSTRVRISPRREISRISAPWLSPRWRASSGCMKQRAPGKAL